MQTLIGNAAMQRLSLGIDGDHLLWKGRRIIQANSTHLTHISNMGPDLEFYPDVKKRDKTLVVMANTKALPPRSSVLLPLTLNGQALSPEGFFFPASGNEGRLLFLPGLVSIKQGEHTNTVTVLVMNPTETHVQLKKGIEVGSVYQLNDNDVDGTELIQLTNQSFLEPRTLTVIETKPPSQVNEMNPTVGTDHFCSLAAHWLDQMVEEENQLMIHQPVRKKRRMSEKPRIGKPGKPTDSPQLKKHHPPGSDQGDEPSITQVLSHIITQNESTQCTKDPPQKFKEVFDKFQLKNTDLNHEQRIQLAEMLTSFKDLWDDGKREGPLVRTTTTEHPIIVDGQPIRSNPRRTTPGVRRDPVQRRQRPLSRRGLSAGGRGVSARDRDGGYGAGE